MRSRFTSVGTQSHDASLPSRTEVRGHHRVPSNALCLTGALVSALALLGCEENHIVNKYYILEDAGDEVTQQDDDAGPTDLADAGTDSGASEPTEPDGGTETDTSEPTDEPGTATDPDDAGAPGETDAGADGGELPHADNPFYEGAPTANTTPEELEIDVFGTVGNRYWFATDPAEVERMNGEQGGGGPIFLNEFGDIYEPPGDGGGANKTYVESLFVTTPEGQTADLGQLSVRVMGQSTYRPWTATTIPNLRLDMDHFTKDLRLGGYEHLRFNNGLVGSIFREKLTLDMYRKLGYPAPRTQFAWVGSNVWGADAWIPYTLVQVYKKSFCADYVDEFGGGCENMWEFYGDFGQGSFENPDSCQSDECDNTRVKELEAAIVDNQYAEDFKGSLEGLLDWEAFHEFQCLSWVFAVGDDALHNSNNVVIVERSDGLFQFLPYSTDISLGQDWYPVVPLAGTSMLAQSCQNDAACWADTISTCERIVEEFTAIDPVRLLDEEYASLQAAGMLRTGDDDRYEWLGQWFQDRLVQLPIELEANRESPQTCAPGQIDCEGYCALPEECWLCQPPVGPADPVEPGPRPIPLLDVMPAAVDDAAGGDAGAAADIVIIDPGVPVDPAPVDGDAGAEDPVEPPPDVCEPINIYKLQ